MTRGPFTRRNPDDMINCDCCGELVKVDDSWTSPVPGTELTEYEVCEDCALEHNGTLS